MLLADFFRELPHIFLISGERQDLGNLFGNIFILGGISRDFKPDNPILHAFGKLIIVFKVRFVGVVIFADKNAALALHHRAPDLVGIEQIIYLIGYVV